MIDPKRHHYRTRDGREARIYAVDGGGECPVHGAILHDDGWHPFNWLADGRAYINQETSVDLTPVRLKQAMTDDLTDLERQIAFGKALAAYADAAGSSWIDPLEVAVNAALDAVLPTLTAAARAEGLPTEPGLYAWVDNLGGSTALVAVDRRPTRHSPGGQLNGTVVKSCTFYSGAGVEEWRGGQWVLLRAFGMKQEGKRAAKDTADD